MNTSDYKTVTIIKLQSNQAINYKQTQNKSLIKKEINKQTQSLKKSREREKQ